MGYLTALTETPARPRSSEQIPTLYLKSFLLMRTLIGSLAFLMPVAVYLGDTYFRHGEWASRGSLSAYYHCGMRDVFTASLCATGTFLITYKVIEKNLDNTLTVIAGAAAIGVAMFPMATDGPLTPLQDRWGEGTVAAIHFASATAFIGCLAGMSYLFGMREGARTGRDTRRGPRFWRDFHWACATLIVGAVIFIAVTKSAEVFDDRSLLYGEVVAVWAFGASWFAKGSELFSLSR
jgi:hypothetical protein